METYEEKTLNRKTIFEGRVITVHLDEVSLPDGKTSTREIVEHPGAVAVIAFTDEGKMVMVRQYRKPLNRALVEIPAGKIDRGEQLEACARRELEEETGYVCAKLTHLVSFYTSPGFCDEILHIYLAEGLTKAEGRHLDEDEFLDLLEVTFEEAENLVKKGEIMDAKTIYAWQYWKALRETGK
ncbi:MAG: ADP-ribose pyrophosphatase [Caldibacillus debilis]|uniref:ADP-ribose pyrophosphatase n=1 Tax=Caldibacillus debilis TaxID=301148 RepID=A0A3E0K1S8_9BACI|nr:NUDIX hydrolase [Caldibacillus debilis]REJ26977.1 MAG: ADP-ribose pyrophosphatase [Caldibacillus debilis]